MLGSVEVFTTTAEQTEMPRIGKPRCYSSYKRFSDEELVPASTFALIKHVEHHGLLAASASSVARHQVYDECLLIWVVPDVALDATGGFDDFLVGRVFQVPFVFNEQRLRYPLELVFVILEL